jgi:hypothetical protein
MGRILLAIASVTTCPKSKEFTPCWLIWFEMMFAGRKEDTWVLNVFHFVGLTFMDWVRLCTYSLWSFCIVCRLAGWSSQIWCYFFFVHNYFYTLFVALTLEGMNLDTYNKKNWWKPQDHIHFTKLWKKYYIGIWHTFVIVAAIIHMLGCQMYLIMDLQKNNWRQQIYMQQISQVFSSNPKII